MKIKLLLASFVLAIMLSSAVNVAGTDKAYNNYKMKSDAKITIDGKADDWADIEGVTLTLKAARPDDSGERTAELKATNDGTNIYFLITVKDDAFIFYNMASGVSHHGAPALALGFPIDANANVQFMGGTDRDTDDNLNKTTGMVDIMHWEFEVDHQTKTGGPTTDTTKDKGHGANGLDDEWATGPWDRHDDSASNSDNTWFGAWDHTAYGNNGTNGDWTFELSRKMASSDKYDVSFAEGDTVRTAIAFWTPNTSTVGAWEDDEHLVNYDNIVAMTIKGEKSSGSSSPLPFVAIFAGLALIPILRKVKSL